MNRLFGLLVAAVVSVVGTGVCHGGFTLEFDTVITRTPPQSDVPWLIATFEDIVDTGDVLLTLQCSLEIAGEFISAVNFNFTGDASKLTPSLLDALDEAWYDDTTLAPVGKINNNGAWGPYDWGVRFRTKNSDSDRFDGSGVPGNPVGDIITIVLSMSDGTDITSDQFNVLNENGNTASFTAAHFQGIAIGEGSGKGTGDPTPIVATPEPGTFALLALGGVGIAAFRRKKKSVAA